MKLIDAIHQVERPQSDNPYEFCSPISKIATNLNVMDFDEEPDELTDRLKSYPVLEWYCTDERVGLYAMYLDGEAVGCHYRNGRKSNLEIQWISVEAAQKTRDVILSYITRNDDFDLINPEQEIGDDHAVAFVGQAIDDEGLYEGRPVKALIWYDHHSNQDTPENYRKEGKPYTVAVSSNDPKANCVLVQDGEEQQIIPIRDFKIPFKLKK